jgi:hypothetical protein
VKAAALRNAAEAKAGDQPDTEATLRAFERSRSRKASVVSRQAGTEDYNRYGAVMSRLIPASLASRYYTRWLRQISTYLDTATHPGRLQPHRKARLSAQLVLEQRAAA